MFWYVVSLIYTSKVIPVIWISIFYFYRTNFYFAICIKYDKTSYKPGDEFEVREEDAKELEYNGYAEVEEVLELKEDEEREKEGE